MPSWSAVCLLRQAARQQRQHLALAPTTWAKRRAPRPMPFCVSAAITLDCARAARTASSRSCSRNGLAGTHRAGLHRAHRHRDVAVAGDEDDRDRRARRRARAAGPGRSCPACARPAPGRQAALSRALSAAPGRRLAEAKVSTGRQTGIRLLKASDRQIVVDGKHEAVGGRHRRAAASDSIRQGEAEGHPGPSLGFQAKVFAMGFDDGATDRQSHFPCLRAWWSGTDRRRATRIAGRCRLPNRTSMRGPSASSAGRSGRNSRGPPRAAHGPRARS